MDFLESFDDSYMDEYEGGEEEDEIEYPDYQYTEGIYENRLEMRGEEDDIIQFLLENSNEQWMLTLHGGKTQEEIRSLPQIWINNGDDIFLSDAFDVEWYEDENAIMFRTYYVDPVTWIQEISRRYPSIEFTLLVSDREEDYSSIMQIKGDHIIQNKEGKYCNYWKPWCERCGEKFARRKVEYLNGYFCRSCVNHIESFIPQPYK